MSFSSAPTRRYFLAGAGGMMLSRSAWAQAPAATVVGLPELPYQKSKLIHGLRWLNEPQHNANAGDTWTCTWADDGNLYSVGDDTSGTGQEGWNLSIYKVEGMPPGHVVTRINDMRGYGHANEGHWWKGAGLAAIDGVLYLGIYSQSVPRVGSATRVSFNADHSSIIKSSDYGKTWSPTSTVEKPMFPGKEFPTPYFVQYGKDYSGAIDNYVYVVSNDGGWNNWNRMLLARISRNSFKQLDRNDWEFFAGAGKRGEPSWHRDRAHAEPIFEHKGYTSMTGIQYVPAVKRFVLGQWAYVAMSGGGDRPASSAVPMPWPERPKPDQADQTMLCLYEAPKPWGPWHLFHAQPQWGPAFYTPGFPAKWFTQGGKRMWIVEGGNYRGPAGGYNFTVQELELTL